MQHWMEAHRLQLNADKTDLLWAGSGCGPAFLGSSGLLLDLGTETIRASDHLCLLGVTTSSDLGPEKHVSGTGICSACFYWLPQICHISQFLDTESETAFVHALIESHDDYCNTMLAGSPQFITDRLQHVLNALARVITGTRKSDCGLSHLLHSELHWLDIPQCIQYKLGVSLLLPSELGLPVPSGLLHAYI